MLLTLFVMLAFCFGRSCFSIQLINGANITRNATSASPIHLVFVTVRIDKFSNFRLNVFSDYVYLVMHDRKQTPIPPHFALTVKDESPLCM